MSTQLTKNFTLQEFVRSQTATRHNINNAPNINTLVSLFYLANVMQDVRNLVDSPIFISSGYRCIELNRKIGSEDTSKHVRGLACDFVVAGMGLKESFDLIKRSHIGFSKMILEFPKSGNGWIHLEILPFGERGKRSYYLAEKVNGETQYTPLA